MTKEDKQAYLKAYYVANRDRLIENMRRRREVSKDADNAARRERYASDPAVRERAITSATVTRLANPEKVRSRHKAWSHSNPERIATYRHRRRAHKQNNGGTYTVEEWDALVERFGNRCLCCGAQNVQLTADHIVPLSKGGSNFIENIQPLCFSCNSSKRVKIVDYREIT